MKPRVTRRELLKLMALGGGGLTLTGLAGCDGSSGVVPITSDTHFLRIDFTAMPDGDGWDGRWRCPGVGALSRAGGEGLLLAGSDIFPNDPRPVAFAVDARFIDGSVRAKVARAGRTAGVVARRVSIRDCYAALYDTDAHAFAIVRRSGSELVSLAQAIVAPTAIPAAGRHAIIELAVTGLSPTALSARLDGADGVVYEIAAVDGFGQLQTAGDAGVLARADTLLPDSNPVLPALGNLHLLPYAVQEGQVVIGTPLGQAFLDLIRQRSTAAFAEIEIRAAQAFVRSAPAVIAATTGAPLAGGASLQVATDFPAEVQIELARSADFADARMVSAGTANGQFLATCADVSDFPAGAEVHWRPRLRRAGQETIGAARRFRVLPAPGDGGTFTVAYGACASQFNAIFDHLTAREPDVFIWQGDLNYPDTHGPFAQSVEGYAGIWRHFLDNPRMAPLFERACFVGGRDDHDYGLQDVHAATLVPQGLAPWDALINPRTYQRISAGLADFWILDQRKFKSDPALPDTTGKTLLGLEQREWLLDGLAGSTAPFQVICSPCTVAPAPGANARDGSWASGFTAERNLLLAHLSEHVQGQAVFLTGDTHFTMLWDRDGLFEQRACPLDIPAPNDQNISNPLLELSFGTTPGVAYWSRRSHFSFLTIGAVEDRAVLILDLVRDDGVTVQSRRFESAA